MTQRKFTAEELTTLNNFKNFFDLLGIPFNIKDLENSDMQVEFKKPSFEYCLQPGNIMKFDNKGEKYFAIVLNDNRCVYVDKSGVIKGYLVNPTMDTPYKALEIRKPTANNFKLVDFDAMDLVWKRPVDKIKKSLSDIEKELGLTPGSLEIM